MSAKRTVRKQQKPVRYSYKLAQEICDEISTSTHSIQSICESSTKYPQSKYVYRWINLHPEFKKLYLEAKQIQILFLTDNIHAIAADESKDFYANKRGELFIDMNNINRARLQIDTIKWAAAKLMPRLFGDRITHTTDSENGESKIKCIAIVPAEQSIDDWVQCNLETSSGASDAAIDVSNP